jgi:hypothetical protein
MFDKNRISQMRVVQYCSHANGEVEIETIVVYPPEISPETSPRINQRTCSHFLVCNLQDKDACSTVLNYNREAAATKALLEK